MGTSKTFDIDMLPYKLEFSLFTTDEIKSLSVAKVITTQTFDILGHPIAGGLYDSQMGTHGKRMEPCATCLNMQACPGHIGHIELNALVYNPFFVKLVQKIANMFCCRCYNIQIHGRETDILKLQLDLIDGGYIVEAKELDALKSKMILENDKIQVKSEDGDVFHSFIIKSRELLKSAISKRLNITKTNCAIRSAILHSTFQRPLNKKCIHCHEVLQHVRYHNRKLVYFMTKAELKSRFPDVEEVGGQYKLILAVDMRKHLREVYKKYSDLLSRIFPIFNYVPIVKASDFSPVDVVFLDTILVTPPKSRPCNVVNEQIVEHPQTALYRSILENNFVLKIIMNHIKNHGDLAGEEMDVFVKAKGNNAHEKLYNAWQTLQMSVDVMIDTTGSHDVPVSAGLKQILEKKEGLIRKHMMGKRVNYAARTVITPDPNINVEEVGIPDIFAKKLSYPVHVTPWNIADLRKMVINGPNVHPGANYIQDERGYTTLIPADNAAKRESMAKLLFSYPENGIKIVHRHVLNGDVLLLNRQPSLHRPSIMAHKARILRGEKTFRLHYSNCKAYNADFDGDEMNAHIPQGEVARSEAYNLVNVANNYLVPKDGTPLGGLIQDHVISGVKLSVRGRFFNREDYQQLVFQGLSHLKTDIKLLPPAIIKPIALWSGKQILSTILINLIPEDCKKINLKSFAKISAKHWNLCVLSTSSKVYQMCESVVYIRQGELLTGVLDKQQYGATTFGLIHCMYELYGGTISTNTLTALTKLFTYFLQREGFSLGVKDILVTKQADRERREIIYESRNIGHTAIASELGLSNYAPLDEISKKMEEAYIKNPNFQVILDRKYKSLLDNYTNDINKACLPNGLLVKFPNNNLQLMVLSGAKGSMVNTMQISSLLGQIELEGKRPPLMISGKSLPSFTSFETSPKAGGFIDGRFMTGIQPQDFFFHCMAGREGLVDTAVKTSRSGYLQRCLIKHLEGLTVNYDLTVRDSDKSVVQYLYGEDGIDILKSKFFIKTFGIEFLIDNSDVILQRRELEKLDKDMENLHKIQHNNKKIRKWLQRRKCDSNIHNLSAFTHFSGELRYEIEVEQPNEKNPKNGRRLLDDAILKLWSDIEKVTKEKYQKKYCKCPDPTNSLYEQDRCYGSVSEKLQKIIDEYMGKYPNRNQDIADIIYLKNMKSLISPGEPVGLLAAQSIGEPSTQMTLNTFHFAGRGEMNVTLGIPRLREILMMATTNIKTPSMDIPIKTYQEDAAEKLRIYLNKVALADVLQYIHVKTQPILREKCLQKYELTFHMLPREAYKNSFYVKPKQIVKFIGERFFNILFQSIIKTAKSQKNIIEFREGRDEKIKDNSDTELDNEPKKTSSNSKNNALADNDNISSDEDQDDQIDATTIKAKTQKIDEAEYDEPDEVDEFENFKPTIDNEEANDIFDNQNSETSASDFQHTNDNNNHFTIEGATNKAMVESYTYDTKQYLWSKLIFHLPMIFKQMNISSIVKDLVKNTNIHQVHNINRAIMYIGKNNEKILKTDGINIAEIIQHHKILCINRLYTNDIHAVARIYGIEAAGQVIINEISNVFKVYGIQIDRRHLSLIADYMTFDGTFQPLSRRGMENSASPLQQMSFESCLQFLKNAVSLGCGDALNSPSARLMVGLPIQNGTGCFDILTNIL